MSENLPAKTQIVAGGAVGALVPQTLDEAFRLSQALAMSGLAPRGMDKPEQIMVAIIAGAELGLAPFQALQSFAVINGRPTLWGDGLMAVARSQGVQVREWIEGQGDESEAFCEVTRPDTGEQITRAFSVVDARKASLWGKQGPWQSYPRRMLGMRARAFALRDGCADMLRGFQVREEVEDYQPIRDVTPQKSGMVERLASAGGEGGFSAEGVEREAPKGRAKPKAPPTPEKSTETAFAPEPAPEAAEGPAPAGDDFPGDRVAGAVIVEGAPEDVVAEGFPEVGEVYHLVGDEWGGNGRRATYQNGAAFSSAGRAGGFHIYAAHGPDEEVAEEPQIRSAPEDRTEAAPVAEKPPAADDPVARYIEEVEAAERWVQIKQSMSWFFKTDDWNEMDGAEQAAVRAKTWEFAAALPDTDDHAASPTAFRLWIEFCKDPDAITGTLAVLEKAKTFANLGIDQQNNIRGAAAKRVSALKG